MALLDRPAPDALVPAFAVCPDCERPLEPLLDGDGCRYARCGECGRFYDLLDVEPLPRSAAVLSFVSPSAPS